MEKIEVIDYALGRTLSTNPERLADIEKELCYIIQGTRQDLEVFKDKYDLEKILINVDRRDFIEYLYSEAVKTYNAASYYYYNDIELNKLSEKDKNKEFNKMFPTYQQLQHIIERTAKDDVNIALYFENNKEELQRLIKTFLSLRFMPNSTYREYIDKFGKNKTATLDGRIVDLFAKIKEHVVVARHVKEANINYNTLNACVRDLKEGRQLRNRRNEYALFGRLFASQDVGKKEASQRDSVLIMNHHENPDFQFIAVADGIGDTVLGEKASNYTLNRMVDWFNSLPEYYYNSPEDLQEEFNKQLEKVNQELYEKFNKKYKRVRAGSTFTGAIITKNKTIISSIGNTRAYAAKDDILMLLTADESVAWPENVSPKDITDQELNNMRFFKEDNNINCLGVEELFPIQTMRVNNHAYDRLVLATDGLYDMFNPDELADVVLNESPENVTTELVTQAMTYDIVQKSLSRKHYYRKLTAGQDNATAAALVKR